jgi:glyoxylase-like metal-dependent hydrolase (beta-lactamase superfamily II)
MHDQFLSNSYLVGGDDAPTAFLVDAGGPVEPLLGALERTGRDLTDVLLTHHHFDHVAELEAVRERFPSATVHAHPLEPVEGAQPLHAGATLSAGGVEVRAIHTPGHTEGMLAFLVGGTDVFTGDTLFKGSVGGVRAPGHTTYEDLRESIMERLLTLAPETRIHPGHTDPTTVADEREHNPFVRVWRGLDPEGDEPCVALGESATLVLMAPDYDGGTKAWVRWSDGRDDIVPGSQVQPGEPTGGG